MRLNQFGVTDRRLGVTLDCARRIEHEGPGFMRASGALLRAGVAGHRGDTGEVVHQLWRALPEFHEAAMPVHAAVTKYLLGRVLGVDADIHRAARALRARGVNDCDRFATSVAPGVLTAYSNRASV